MRRLGTRLFALALAASASGEEATPSTQAGSPSDRLATFFGRTKGITRLVPASEVWASMRFGTGKFFVVDVRPTDEYAKGHVPGALSVPLDVLFRPESLAKLPRDKPLLLVCKTGHMESMALGGLVALGYEPWVMRFGMLGWDAETPVKAGSSEQGADTVHGVGGPIERQSLP